MCRFSVDYQSSCPLGGCISNTNDDTTSLNLHIGHTITTFSCGLTSHLSNTNTMCKLINKRGGCPHGVMVKAVDCGIVVREFVLQSRYYIHFRANTLGKGMNPHILPAMG